MLTQIGETYEYNNKQYILAALSSPLGSSAENVGLSVSYTGSILIGRGFVKDFFNLCGFAKNWGYSELIELIFDNGRVIEQNDYSTLAKKQRDFLVSKRENKYKVEDEGIFNFISESFSSDYTAVACAV